MDKACDHSQRHGLRRVAGRACGAAIRALVVTALGTLPAIAAPPDAGCTCRNRDGSKYELGQTACIRVDDKSYLARCEMDLNVTTWRKLRDGCPEA